MTTPRAYLPHLDPDDIPSRAELARDDAEPPLPWLTGHGHRLVGFLRIEPVDHLAYDGTLTLCGQPFETKVARNPRPLCDECTQAADLV